MSLIAPPLMYKTFICLNKKNNKVFINMVKSLKFSKLKYITAFLTTSILLLNTSQLFAADATISTATTASITLGNDDDLIITSAGSVSTAGANLLSIAGTTTTINNSGTIATSGLNAIQISSGSTTITNSGTISSNVTGTGSATIGNGIGNSGTITLLTNSTTGTITGTVSTTGDGGNGIVNNSGGTIVELNNAGSITGSKRDGIDQIGTITLLTNSGTITGSGFDGINNDGPSRAVITTLNNSGTITGNRHGIGQDTGTIGTLTNTGTISGTTTAGIYSGSNGIITTINNNSGSIIGGTSGIQNLGTITSINNSSTLSGGTNSILNTGTIGSINLNKGSILIGNVNSSTAYTLNINVGAAKSYFISTTGAGVVTVNDLNNRPVIKGSAYGLNIGSMEMAGENLYQRTSNTIDIVDSNINNKENYIQPYYSVSTRNSENDSSAIRKFNNTKQGLNAGGQITSSSIPLQFFLNLDQSENNIDSDEHTIKSNSFALGLVAPNYQQIDGYGLSLKGIIGYSENKTERKLLDNTSSTGKRVLTGEYKSIYAIAGANLAKTVNLDNAVKANFALGIDLTSEIRDSYTENLYFSYDNLNLVQLQPKVQSEFVKTLNDNSNAFIKISMEAREILSGKTQNFSANGTGTSYTSPTNNDIYATVAVGYNSKIENKLDFYFLASAKDSIESVKTYQGSVGIKGSF